MDETVLEEINQSLWKVCDIFRGKVNSNRYKDYVVTMFFLKSLSDIYEEHLEEYKKLYNDDQKSIKRAISKERFLFDKESTFKYLYSKRNDSEIGAIINNALEGLEAKNPKLRGVFRSIDFNSEAVFGKTKDRNAILRTLLEAFAELDLRPSRVGQNKITGDAYLLMIERFAIEAKEEFFIPSMVSELLARLVKPQENDRIYDPVCGCGSLLLRVANKVPNKKVAVYGQEINERAYSLCMMNMFLHGIDDAKIACGDTLANPLHLEDGELMKFQVVVATPPFSLKKWAMGFAGDSNKNFRMEPSLDPYGRFDWGVPPRSQGDYAFVLHMLHSLAEGGRMAVILPHGVLFRGISSEKKIRQQIIEMNLLDAVIGLPGNLFYNTAIPTCIMVFKRNRTKKEILFIDASGEGNYEKDRYQNKLREQDIEKLVDTYEKYETIEKYSYVASKEEIKENDYNLNIPKYVDTFEEEEPVDIDEVKENIVNIKEELEKVEKEMEKYLEELGL